MRQVSRLSIILLIGVLLAGCPWVNGRQHTFTSADPRGNGAVLDGPDYGAPGEDTATEGEGEAEREVVEPDVIRRDGNLLYVLNQYRGLSIVDLDTDTLVAQAPTYGYPRDLYLVGDRAYVLVAYAGNIEEDGGAFSFDISSRVYVLDVSDPASTAIVGEFDLAGDLVDSRLVGDVLYAISAEYEWYYEGGGGVAVDTEVVKAQTSSSWVTSVNVADPENIYQADQMSFEGYGNVIQANNSAIFVAASDWNTGDSVITYIDISDAAGAIAVRDAIQVHGNVADQYKMDAYNKVLRVVSNTWWPNRDVYVTTVDLSNPDALAVLGEVTIPGAAGETLFATRFDGPRGYVVTYFMKDPLFVLDLSDPANPVVAGSLEIPGWSTHIEPRGDRLVALGVDDTEGREVKVSLFDVSDPTAPAELDVESFGDGWSWSSAYSDVKAFTVLDDMIIVPFSGWSESAGGFERLQFIGYTGNSLEKYGYVDVQGQVLRSFQYGDPYYGVTTEQVARIDASDPNAPAVVKSIPLAENVADFQELNAALGVEIITSYEKAATTVRTVDGAGVPLGELELDFYGLTHSFAHGSDVVLVATGWNERAYYEVAVVSCATSESPVLTAQFKLDVTPYWGDYYWYDGPVYAEDGVAPQSAANAKDASYWYYYNYYWWPWYGETETAFLLGDAVVLRCVAEDYDTVLGSDDPAQGAVVIPLADLEARRTVGLGFDGIVKVNSADAKLYVGTKEEAGDSLLGQSLCAYYLREVDPVAETAGPAANVPGEFISYDAERNILAVRDFQYRLNSDIQQSIKTVSWDGGDTAELVDLYTLPEYYNTLEADGAWIHVEQYDAGYSVTGLKIDASGGITATGTVKVTDQWATLIDADESVVYLSIAGRALVRYDMKEGGELVDLTQAMSVPTRLCFGEDTVYGPMGYAGVLRLAR